MRIGTDPGRTKHLIGTSALMLSIVACTCGPVNTVLNAQATVQAARFEIESLATQAEESAPTLERELLDFQATVEAGADVISQWAFIATASSQFGVSGWSAAQMRGRPDVYPECGDIAQAWSSDAPDGAEQVSLRYASPVGPQRIDIYETFTPGAIIAVDVVGLSGNFYLVYASSAGVVEECPRILTIDVTGVDEKVNEVVIYLDETGHPASNQIDAVQLTGTQ